MAVKKVKVVKVSEHIGAIDIEVKTKFGIVKLTVTSINSVFIEQSGFVYVKNKDFTVNVHETENKNYLFLADGHN